MLLVDDQPVVLELLGNILESMGITFHIAVGGEQAVEKASRNRYNLILIDINMPGLDGLEATRRLRENPDNKNIPIVAMSGLIKDEEKEMIASSGCTEHLDKPIRREDLVLLVKRYIIKDEERDKRKEYVQATGAEPQRKVVTGRRKLWKRKAPIPMRSRKAMSEKEFNDMLMPMRRRFMEELPVVIDDLNRALNSENYDRICHIGHTLKGNAGLVQFKEISAIGAWLQENARPGTKDMILARIAELQELCSGQTRRS